MTDWDFLYAQIIASTGWNWNQVDALTIPRYQALKRYWDDYPPAHLLLRALTGFQRRTPRSADSDSFETLAALAPNGTFRAPGMRQ